MPIKIIGDALPNMPWEDKPAACFDTVWRYSQNPVIDRKPLKNGDRIFNSALVPGYIVKWHAGKNKEGLLVTEVEPIHDKQVKARIRKIIRETEHVNQTEFW